MFADDDETDYECRLIHGHIDFVRVQITKTAGFSASFETNKFHFYLGPVKNPSANKVDLNVRVRAESQDLTNLSFITVAEELVTYIDTVITGSPTTITSPDVDNDCFVNPGGTCVQPDLVDTAQILKLNIEHSTKALTTSD